MCGIAGIVDSARPVAQDLIRRMTDTLTHRGPDSDGYHFEDGVGLGHRRLSIIDLDTGDQPIYNEDRSIAVIFNGEIYNFQRLMPDLKKRGHQFRTHSDTELIVHLYEEYGEAFVDHLIGMFAIAIWDAPKKKLVLARDRLGKKPLFWSHDVSRFAFGSEIKALLADPAQKRDLSFSALADYLTFGYVPSPDTIYTQIHKLNPGHLLVLTGNKVDIRCYWQPRFEPDRSLTETEVLARVDEIINDATSIRMISDVPLGAFLSGGVDSSAVVAAMAAQSSRPVKTFSIGFEEAESSELAHARKVAEHLGTEHHEMIVKPDIVETLHFLLDKFDEPFADSSMIPTFEVARQARRQVTVALTGDGGDEVFAGYTLYQNLLKGRKLDRIPGSRLLAGIGVSLPGVNQRLRRRLSMLARKPSERHLALVSMIQPELRRVLFAGELQRAAIAHQSHNAEWYRAGSDGLSTWQLRDTRSYLPNDVLTKVDRASMAVSLETRSPLLDHRLIDFMATVPSEFKMPNGESKHLLKKLAAQKVPPDVIYRPKKGFSIPAMNWFKGPLKPVLTEHVLSDQARTKTILDQSTVRKMIAQHESGRANHSSALYAILYLELWMRGRDVSV